MTKTLFTSTLRAAGNHTSPTVTCAGFAGARFFQSVTAMSTTVAATSVTITLYAVDRLSGSLSAIHGAAFAAATTTGIATLTVYPGVAETANQSVSDVLADEVCAVAAVTGAAAGCDITFSLTADLIR